MWTRLLVKEDIRKNGMLVMETGSVGAWVSGTPVQVTKNTEQRFLVGVRISELWVVRLECGDRMAGEWCVHSSLTKLQRWPVSIVLVDGLLEVGPCTHFSIIGVLYSN